MADKRKLKAITVMLYADQLDDLSWLAKHASIFDTESSDNRSVYLRQFIDAGLAQHKEAISKIKRLALTG